MERRSRSLLSGQVLKQLVQEVIDSREQTKDDFFRHLEWTDLKIADMVESNPFITANRHYELCSRLQAPTPKTVRTQALSIPKGNTLTDSLLKTTLGAEQKLAKQYDNLCRKHGYQGIRQASVEDIKKRFAQSNKFQDSYANTKAQHTPKRSQPRPLIDNQHQEYMKTQLMFLEKPSKLNESLAYHSKKLKNVSNKIEQLGGIEDTLKSMQLSNLYMEQSLKCYEIEQRKKNQTYQLDLGESHTSFNYSRTNASSVVFDKLNQSRQMRSAFAEAYRKFRS